MKNPKNAYRIDVHQHIVPPFYADGVTSHGGDPSGTVTPAWSVGSALDFMDQQEIAVAVLSLTAPSVVSWPAGTRRAAARRVNEYTAEVVAKQPGRFGNFATLPLPDIEGALLELAHCFDVLHADGVILLSNYNGHYVGDAMFEPVWAELNLRKAVVLLHPTQPVMASATGVAGPLVDYPFDTTRAALQLVLNGVMDRYQNVHVILAHAGGFLPYASHRMVELARLFEPTARAPDELLATFKRFYFDTALSSGPAALPTLTAFADPARILFGSDFPYVPTAIANTFTANLDNYPDLDEGQRSAINYRNASALFPRFAAR